MNKLAPLVVSLCLIAWVGVAAQKAPMEGLKFKLDPDWYMLDSGGDSTSGYAVYLRHQDNPNHWNELFRFETGRMKSNQKSPQEEFNTVKADTEKHCRGATVWNVIEHDENSILFEWQSKPCKVGEHELDAIWRIIQGKQSWFDVMYTARVYEVAPETRMKWIATLKDATINPDAGPVDLIGVTIDIDEVVPFPVDKVMAALKPAMESQDCYVTSTTADSIECKRPRASTTAQQEASGGGESVTARLEAQGDQAHVIITTGKGFYGRLFKKNWSTPIYQEMMKNLQKAQP